jgi:hypothetical protein
MRVHDDLERLAIEARAYQLYVARGCVDGQALEDWLTAEQEICKEIEAAQVAPPKRRVASSRA